jgi:uncharacterized lipoprotein NlpE involved in copper resistance
MKKILFLAFITISMISCSNSAKQSQEEIAGVVDVIHTSQNSIDYEGTYEGILPCADCEGIKTVINLKSSSYIMKTTYLGKNKTVYETTGSYSWDKSGQIIIMDGIKGSPNQYFIGEGYMTQLDMEGHRITGELAEKYTLKKKK